MKYKKIVLFFCIALPTSVLMRTLQIFFTIDATTGFFNPEYKAPGYYLLAFIIVMCAVLAVICFTGHRNPEHAPEINPFISVASVLLAVAVGVELFAESFSGTVMAWQTALLNITGGAAVIYFICYGISGFVKYKLPPLSSVIPAFYFVMRIICAFTSVSSLALITDNLLILSAYCTVLIFFISFGKLYNGIDTETNFRKLMASGLVSVILCLTISIPHIIVNLISANGYHHTSGSVNASLLAIGLFIAAFVFFHFSLSNTTAHSPNPSDIDGHQLYVNSDNA